MSESTKNIIHTLIKDHFGVDVEIEGHTSLEEQFDAIEVDTLELVMAIEEELDIEMVNYDGWEADNAPEDITPDKLVEFASEYLGE